MDSPRSSSALSSRSSRRSFPNLHHLSLAPLSSKYPLDASSPTLPSDDPARAARTSYIQGKSAPTTPGILNLSQSRSSSRHGRSTARTYAYNGYFLSADAPSRGLGAIPKAKSSSALLAAPAVQPPGPHALPHQHQHQHPYAHAHLHTRKGVAPTPLRPRFPRRGTDEPDDEWLHRAGLAIASETRESKGQSWLVRRASSTSLVLPGEGFDDPGLEHPFALLSGEHFADDEYSPLTPRLSRWGSRAGSGVGSCAVSARNSRRGSMVSSKIELMMAAGQRTPSVGLEDGYFGEQMVAEPDFVEPDDEEVGDEEEVARLARERGFGLGGWMDRLIGWTLFRVEEDGEDTEDDEEDTEREESLIEERLKLRKEVEARRRKLEREMIIRASTAGSKEKGDKGDTKESTETQSAASDSEGGWQDAAWLLSVASKVLL